MKRKLSIVLSLVAGVAIVSLAADMSSGKPQTDKDAVQEMRAQLTELRTKVQRLEGQVQGLEDHTKKLEAAVEQLKKFPAPTPMNLYQSPAPSPSPAFNPHGSSRPPTIWGQGEVNGWTFYYVPCEQQSR
jgi:hypothetical protein